MAILLSTTPSSVQAVPLNTNKQNLHIPFHVNGKTFLLLSLDAERPYHLASQTCSVFKGTLANINSSDIKAFAAIIEGKDPALIKPMWINSFNGRSLAQQQQHELQLRNLMIEKKKKDKKSKNGANVDEVKSDEVLEVEVEAVNLPQCMALLPNGEVGLHPDGCDTLSWSLCEVSEDVLTRK